LGLLDAAVARLREQLDHANLVTDVPAFAEGAKIPTTEELATYIAAEVQVALGTHGTVDEVRVAEEPTLWATWRRV
jgi:6-pyruvoyl-tetrahydropterin synthase